MTKIKEFKQEANNRLRALSELVHAKLEPKGIKEEDCQQLCLLNAIAKVEHLVDASLQVYARTGRYPNSEGLHNAAIAIIAQQADEMAHLTRDRDIWKEVCGVNKQRAEAQLEHDKLRARLRVFEGCHVFEGLTLPTVITAALGFKGPLLDISWGNDACASFILRKDEDKPNAVTLWVDYEKQEDRECEGASRFTVDRRLPDDTFVTYYQGDDAEAAMETLKSAP